MGFNFVHFANFKLAYFEIEVSFNFGKLTKWLISLANFDFGYLKGAPFKYRVDFCSFFVKRKF